MLSRYSMGHTIAGIIQAEYVVRGSNELIYLDQMRLVLVPVSASFDLSISVSVL